ncbi:MBL fold metallo-hydrolase [Flavobacteriaceae bacterium R38]|nr:MBL fold metallo-hydrolase [Flavobacteriaceae bacterium R38]
MRKFIPIIFFLVISLSFFLSTSCSSNKKEANESENWCDQNLRPELSELEEIKTTNAWFKVYLVGKDVYAIAEPYNFQEVISYLILGEEKALLFDTGMGLSSIATVVKEITNLPVTVINSHTHYDHIGGNYEFNTILARNTSYTQNRAKNGMNHDVVKHEVSKEAFCAEKLPELDTLNYRIRSFVISDFIEDGNLIDLGNRKVKIVSVPGHTPDAIALLDEENGYLWTGDTFYEAPIWLFDDETNLEDYKNSIDRLASLSSKLDKVFPAHNKPIAKPIRLVELVDAFEQVLNGTKKNKSDDNSVASFEFEHFSFRIRNDLLK